MVVSFESSVAVPAQARAAVSQLIDGVPPAPRALRTPLIDQLEADPASIDPAQVSQQLVAAVRAGGGHELLPFAGQSVQLIHDIAPAAEVVDRLVVECAGALERANAMLND